MTAIEAKEVGLANDVFPAETFEENVKSRLDEMSQYHPMALERIEKIIRSHDTKCYI
jgi:enoyl-CoA hydratase/carnithine racemase